MGIRYAMAAFERVGRDFTRRRCSYLREIHLRTSRPIYISNNNRGDPARPALPSGWLTRCTEGRMPGLLLLRRQISSNLPSNLLVKGIWRRKGTVLGC